jgi:hypothetical protein
MGLPDPMGGWIATGALGRVKLLSRNTLEPDDANHSRAS